MLYIIQTTSLSMQSMQQSSITVHWRFPFEAKSCQRHQVDGAEVGAAWCGAATECRNRPTDRGDRSAQSGCDLVCNGFFKSWNGTWWWSIFYPPWNLLLVMSKSRFILVRLWDPWISDFTEVKALAQQLKIAHDMLQLGDRERGCMPQWNHGIMRSILQIYCNLRGLTGCLEF